MKKDNKLLKTLINLGIVTVSIALATLAGYTFVDVIARYAVGKPFGRIEEIQTALIVWVVSATGGATYRIGDHSAIEILYEIFPKSVRKIVSISIGLVVIAVPGFLCYTSVGYLQLFMRTRKITTVFSLLFIWIYMIVPVPCMLQIFNYLFVNVFGYEGEVEKLVEEDEDK